MKILAIDDEPLFCSILEDGLAKLGMSKVDIAQSGEQALSLVSMAGLPYDCFLVDIRMEPMDGIELVRRLRALPKYRHTPIIMVSALTEKSAIDAAFIAGANDYITKPLDLVELKARLSMAGTFNGARAETQTLQDHLVASEEKKYADTRFEDAFRIEDVEALTSLMTLENYTLKLGNLRLHATCAVAFKVQGADLLFARMDNVAFADLLADLAALLSYSMGGAPHLLAYAGSGIFVAVLPRAAVYHGGGLQSKVDEHLATLRRYYAQTGLVAPAIVVGHPARNSLLSFDSPTRMIKMAIAFHEQGGARRDRKTLFSWT